ncbi:MAG: hypothetical protein LBK94_00775 [Prevotellaceae bacterium]|jgi:hypothetical protein|nr:hypothetical protein [Prevotellaceae bacterium]
MTKTGQQIEDDVYELVKDSALKSFVNGDVYKYGTRPCNSKAEDIVVKFVSALSEQIQSGTAVVNIYVLDIDAFDSGNLIRNIERCKQIEQKANEWAVSLSANRTDYLFSLAQTIYTEEEPDINQHFVSIRLKFKLLTD